MDNSRDRRGGEKRRRNALGIDTSDPVVIARFGLGLGYEDENVVNALIKRCSLDKSTAQRIVAEQKTEVTG